MALVTSAVMQTDVGMVRPRNEDAAYADPQGRFAIVADGMGGHGAGDVASAMAVELLRAHREGEADRLAAYARSPRPAGREAIAARLRAAVEGANHAVYERSVREPDKHQMGTTLEVMVMCGPEALIAHVGDSRSYLLREGLLTQLTEDHSVAETMRRAGTMDDATAAVSPMRSVLSNAIGVTPEVSVDLIAVALHPGDRLLLCSDGLHDYFTRDEVGLHLTGRAPTIGLARLIEQARARGGHDNITGIVIEARGRAAATAPIMIDDGEGDGDAAGEGAVDAADDDAITTPVAVPLPLSGVSDVSVANFVDRSLREQSRPHPLPPRRR